MFTNKIPFLKLNLLKIIEFGAKLDLQVPILKDTL